MDLRNGIDIKLFDIFGSSQKVLLGPICIINIKDPQSLLVDLGCIKTNIIKNMGETEIIYDIFEILQYKLTEEERLLVPKVEIRTMTESYEKFRITHFYKYNQGLYGEVFFKNWF